MKPRISNKGKLILRSTAASTSLMRALLKNESHFVLGNDIIFKVKVAGGAEKSVNAKNTLTLSNEKVNK